MLDRNGKPNYLNMRKDKGEEFYQDLQAQRKALYASWEIEWVSDGTLPALGLRYVAVHDNGREREHNDFASAMLSVWPVGCKEASGHVDYIKPQWMRDAEAMQAEYSDAAETQAGLLQF